MEALGGRREDEKKEKEKKSHVTGNSRYFSGSHEMQQVNRTLAFSASASCFCPHAAGVHFTITLTQVFSRLSPSSVDSCENFGPEVAS